MILEHMKTPINKYTFKSKKIKKWVETNCEGQTLNLYAGKTKLDINEFRVDCDTTMNADIYQDAFNYVYHIKTHTPCKLFKTILLDPPYSHRKSMEFYNGKKSSRFNAIKDMLPNIVEPGGIIITFGYQSVSMGKKRGFEIEKILVISHGGAIHDTIATIERMV